MSVKCFFLRRSSILTYSQQTKDLLFSKGKNISSGDKYKFSLKLNISNRETKTGSGDLVNKEQLSAYSMSDALLWIA